MADREAHIPSVAEEVVGVVDVTTLSSRQYCVILDPVGPDGKPQLGNKRVVKVSLLKSFCLPLVAKPENLLSSFQGERSFFLQPGECFERGIQDVYILSEEEGLVLRAVEAFNDTEEVGAGPTVQAILPCSPLNFPRRIEKSLLFQRFHSPSGKKQNNNVTNCKQEVM